MEHYLTINFAGTDYLVKYTGDLNIEEVEDCFSSYIDNTEWENSSNEKIIDDVMSSFKNITWKFIFPHYIAI